ncbi:hypothetical protein A3A84_00625 [Candidatus Collierbacteria bacterium RIFCSPLOWO2_01_FULL_50_23]|uniref:HPr kinase/phosphorylase C-terminal domain-containing protein n=2 Tax=Candidatus Collieribacteriota TaxID=1752725 RepID=A0A1F5EU28_9BACT|nr:MAG: hypothetical protein A3D09_02430 [Candidatus Collierbacteria bacterium RIFCSPHIGHO2_02_FULL_49_10]OGD72015.1 MAG: hypothetical protein A2703_03760 [Candidatus Collierbacteria bacterium RIFCSPHIGHO2_01_FULL_50_25]OGD74844.1 MAG: hypothetical protein A3A84_00625 [Candidatus Collierbacteria bacterium RIFCSPLOWO2_01_FULL_50_23]
MKDKKTVFISFLGYTLALAGEFEAGDEEISVLAGTLIPGAVVVERAPKVDFSLTHFESSERRLERIGNGVVIYDNWGGKLSLDAWHALYSAARILMLKKKYYCVHSACVGGEKNVLLVGHTGCGKSNILLKLVNDYDWKVFSGNKTVISFENGGVTALDGTKTMSISSTDADKFPQLVAKRVDYQNRTAFLLDQSHYFENSPIKIDAIYVVRLNDGVAENNALEFPSSMHTLYPFFMDTVNADTVLCDGEDVFAGTPPEGSQKYLSQSLAKTLSFVKASRISGSIDFVTKIIAEDL